MTSTTMDDAGSAARFWTVGRLARWAAVWLLLTIVAPVMVGIAVARLGPDWRDVGRLVAMGLAVIGMIGATVAGWRSYNRHMAALAARPWEQRAARKQEAISTVWRDCALAGGVVGAVAALSVTVPAGAPRLALAGVAAVALGFGVVRGTVQYMRTIDEQERDANLWATYWGLSLYATLFFLQYLGGRFGIVIPHVHDIIFGLVLAVAVGVYIVRRFR